jgi:hypothetical protein
MRRSENSGNARSVIHNSTGNAVQFQGAPPALLLAPRGPILTPTNHSDPRDSASVTRLSHPLRRTFTIGVLVIQLAAGLFAEAFHTDPVIGSSGGDPTISTHDCGARERHKPAERDHSCQTCLLGAQRLMLQPPAAPGTAPLAVVPLRSESSFFGRSAVRPSSIVPRGPPAA